ncbi:transposase [Desulfobacterota bacterium AH_259_B03_O07]|nr:transposase [Desulfobacterota bacterium AH_259_B03_O07]
MARPLRIQYPGALYHITSRGKERKKIYLDDSERKKFLKTLEYYQDRPGILIHCYVLMYNHYHIVIETPEGNLLKVMHGINSGI